MQLHGLSDRVIFAGAIPHDSVLEHIAAMDIGVMPDSNQFWIANEATRVYGNRLCTVAPQLLPIQEIIADGVTGRLFVQRDHAGFVKALTSLIGNAVERNLMAASAREYVLTKPYVEA